MLFNYHDYLVKLLVNYLNSVIIKANKISRPGELTESSLAVQLVLQLCS